METASLRRTRIGRTDLELSVVGLGTCSLRLLPEEQALATLRSALEEGIDWFHTSPDYGGADDLVARAIR
jgi:aryl-alcohol dehydrogenase-like predicted oxidoreductase